MALRVEIRKFTKVVIRQDPNLQALLDQGFSLSLFTTLLVPSQSALILNANHDHGNFLRDTRYNVASGARRQISRFTPGDCKRTREYHRFSMQRSLRIPFSSFR